MVVPIAKFWKKQLCPDHWLQKLSMSHDDLVTDQDFAEQVLGLSMAVSPRSYEMKYTEIPADVKVSQFPVVSADSFVTEYDMMPSVESSASSSTAG